jgi:hypothetical protein
MLTTTSLIVGIGDVHLSKNQGQDLVPLGLKLQLTSTGTITTRGLMGGARLLSKMALMHGISLGLTFHLIVVSRGVYIMIPHWWTEQAI